MLLHVPDQVPGFLDQGVLAWKHVFFFQLVVVVRYPVSPGTGEEEEVADVSGVRDVGCGVIHAV
jgi:hypothetical protein